ncbi:MAG TPA: hypothetical protein O0X39_07425 [Methanocorpusculum sp.]|nr:hypothetical protein [Methanocorpusculum sp.]
MAEEEDFDLVIPPGCPRTVIRDMIQQFDVELVEVTRTFNYANMENDERQILALRGKKEEVEKANEFMVDAIRKFIEDNSK